MHCRLRNCILDGGGDAPLTDRGRIIFRATISRFLPISFVMLAIAIRGR
jgi:hypothetical protein